jgi:hypothetical protein
MQHRYLAPKAVATPEVAKLSHHPFRKNVKSYFDVTLVGKIGPFKAIFSSHCNYIVACSALYK